MAQDELEITIEELAVVLDAHKDAAAHAHAQVQHTLSELRELVTLLREQQTAAATGDESLRHSIGHLENTLWRVSWKMLTVRFGDRRSGGCWKVGLWYRLSTNREIPVARCSTR